MCKVNLLQCPIKLPEFRLGLLDILLQLGKELLPELLLCRLPCLLYLFLIIQQSGILQTDVFIMERAIAFIRSRAAKVMRNFVGMHLLFHVLRELLRRVALDFLAPSNPL